MLRKLLVDQVTFGDVALPGGAEVVVAWRRFATGRTEWSAKVTVPGLVQVPESGRFVGRAATGAVTGDANAATSVDSGPNGPRTTITWQGTGELSLPD